MDPWTILVLLFFSIEAADKDSLSTSTCKKLTSEFTPKVTPWNTTHLLVSWSELLQNCYGLIDTVEIIGNDMRKERNFLNGKAYTEQNPCKKDFILLFLKKEREFFRFSKGIGYNSRITKEERDGFYGGMMKKITHGICLKERSIVLIPEPPKAIEACILTKGEFQNPQFTKVGQTENVTLTIVDPRNENQTVDMNVTVSNIQMCSATSPSLSRKAQVFAIGLGCGLSIILLTVGVFLCRQVYVWKVDTNDVYGTYSRGEGEEGEYGDGDVVEVIDNNDYYAA